MGFAGRNLVHIADLSIPEIEHVLDVAEKMAPAGAGRERLDLGRGKVLATLFFEPSTRTRLSFESAMARLGGTTLTLADSAASSVTKGETLADTIRMVDAYADAIVLRHPREGAARLAAKYASVPVINAGDGAGQHPTQTLLDLFTIRRSKGRLDGNRIALVGDLRYGRTVHSLAHALSRFGCEMTFVAPDSLQMPKNVQEELKGVGGKFTLTSSLEDAIATSDVLYVTRIKKERFPDEAEYRKVQGVYRVTRDHLQKAKQSLVILHPLPRVGEIDPDVDETHHAKYFEQAANGVPVRMALLSLLLGLTS